jgi:hypothetical protein
MSVSRFVMGRLLAQSAGISDAQRANTYGLASAFVGSSLPGLLVVRQVAANEAASAPPSTTPAPPVPPGATLPDAPGNVIATAGERQVTVTWDAPNDGGSPIQNYVVTTFSGGAPQYPGLTFPASAKDATITALQDGTPYTFEVVAVNAIGSSQPAMSNPATPGTLPDAPTGIVVTRSDGTLTVKWGPPKSTGGSQIKAFDIVVLSGTRVVRTTTASGSETTATIDHLDAGANYTVAVSAVNDTGEGQSASGSAPAAIQTRTVAVTSATGGTKPQPKPAGGPNGGSIDAAVTKLEGDIIKVRDELRESTRELRTQIDAGFSNVLQGSKPPASTAGSKKS